jgi:sialate O-acetylesterase
MFGNNMVLQQNSEVAIWGWAIPQETVKIVCSWNQGDTVFAEVSNNAKWQTTIQTIDAGGPYSISISGSSNIKLDNVMMGEVWLCSGQSNMEMSVNQGIFNGEEETAKANNSNIRILHVQKIAADYPQLICQAEWEVCSPETMRSTSAVSYFFAKEIQQKLNVPVGIIVSAWGGTAAEVWIDRKRITENEKLDSAKYDIEVPWSPKDPGVLYNSMIYPVAPYGIAGTIWYQGESSRRNYWVYFLLMENLIEGWRSDFKKEFPFYLVQIAPFAYQEAKTSAYLREQQELIVKNVPKTGMIVISDLVDDFNNVHPKNKIDVGKRLANYALAETYGQKVGAYKSPTFQSMEIIKNKIRISFNDVITGLVCKGEHPSNFQVAGEDGNFVPAKASIDGKTILVSSKLIKNPVAVHHCFDDASIPNVFSEEGLPLAPFRTDNW